MKDSQFINDWLKQPGVLPIIKILVSVFIGIMISFLVLGFEIKAMAIIGIGLLTLIIHKPYTGLVLTLIVLFNLANPGIFGYQTGLIFQKLSKVLALITLLGIILHFLTHRIQIIITREMGWVLLFTLVVTLSTLYAVKPDVARQDCAHFIAVIFLYGLIVSLVQTADRLEKTIFLIIGLSLVASIVAILQHFLPIYQVDASTNIMQFGKFGGGLVEAIDGSNKNIVRVAGTLWHSNWLTIFLVSVLPLNLYFWRHKQSLMYRSFIFVAIVTSLIALVFTFTRMSALGVLFVLTLVYGKKMIKKITIWPMIIAAIFIVFFMLPDTYKLRVLSVSHYQKSESLSSRWVMQKVGFDIFKKNWCLGVGYGNYGVEFAKDSNWLSDLIATLGRVGSAYDPDKLGAHNMFLEIAVETGVIGFIVFIIMLLVAIKTLYDIERYCRSQSDDRLADLAVVLQIGLSGFLFLGFFLHALDQKILWVLLGLTTSFRVAVFSGTKMTNKLSNDKRIQS
ncbi:MAG: hypothetical protein GY699_19275 [Desulfobacteraceae bacterium]|nr:hypothetical protein [Desulfobacteraceae bacterium]